MRESVEQAQRDPGARERGRRDHRRVNAEIRGIVLSFCREHLFDTFHMQDLTDYVRERVHVAPDSAGRILRQLRKEEIVQYKILSRRNSLYSVLSVSD